MPRGIGTVLEATTVNVHSLSFCFEGYHGPQITQILGLHTPLHATPWHATPRLLARLGTTRCADKRKYNVMLLTLKTTLDVETGISTGNLTADAARVDLSVTTSEQVVAASRDKSSVWAKYLAAGLQALNKAAVSNAQKVQKFAVVAGDFSEKGGELTATLKLKRRPTEEKYTATIDAMYK